MRKKIVAGNWKMNTTLSEGMALASAINQMIDKNIDCSVFGVVIAPPFTHLSEINKIIDPAKICLAAQNCASESKGAYTGEVSAEMLKSAGCRAIILGHSERRTYYKEDNATLYKKIKLVINNEMKPIFCIGEVLEERNANKHFEVVRNQVEEVLFKLSPEEFEKVIIAYEPVWAIGTGLTATPEQAQEMHKFIRNLLSEKFGNLAAENTTILYGGSCNSKNAKELFANQDVDGGLIGGASLKADEFLTIIKSF